MMQPTEPNVITAKDHKHVALESQQRQRKDGNRRGESVDETTSRPGSSEAAPSRGTEGGGKLRGMNKDFPEVRISKTITWLLRHGAKGEGLVMREDGYVQVHDLLANRRLKGQGLSWEMLKDIVEKDQKRRYALVFEGESWWIRANQGHSIKTVQMEMTPVLSVRDIPTGIAVHGTTLGSWQSIATQGLSRMKRNHIHLAQGLPGENVTSGMRKSSQVFIYINIEKAIEAGIKFYLSENGVVLSTGDEDEILKPEFFEKIVDAKGELLLS